MRRSSHILTQFQFVLLGTACIVSAALSQAPPTITSFSPTFGQMGASVTITGSNFSPVAANNIVRFGGVSATVSTASATSLSVAVPTGGTYAPVSVTVGGYTAYSRLSFLQTFQGVGSLTSSSLASSVDFTTGINPQSIALGDVDGDGKTDLVAVNFNSSSVSVFRNTSINGSITSTSFASRVDFTTGTNAASVALADVDGDGKLDLVVANAGSNTVSVFRNTTTSGSITSSSFASKVDFTTGTNPQSVAVADLDGDGKLDLAVVNTGLSTISVFRNTSSVGSITAGSFAGRVDFPSGAGPQYVALGDLDGDGRIDLVVTNSTANTVSALRNTSTSGTITSSSFAAKVDFSTGNYPYQVALGDVDGDGKLDLAVTNWSSSTVSVFRNTSISGNITAGSFASKVDFATGTNPRSVALGDLDGDGKVDLVVANANSNSISLFRNLSTSGSITTGSLAAKLDFGTGTSPYSVSVADVDGDGKVDIEIVNSSSNTASVFRNAAVVPVVAPILSSPANGATSVPTAPVLSWNASVGATKYRLQVSTSSTFSPLVFDVGGVTSTSYPVTGLANSTLYYWQVNASNDQGTSGWSTTFSFTTNGPPPTISFFSPTSGPVGTSVTLTGTNFSSTPGNNTVYLGGVKAQVLSATATQLTVSVPNGTTCAPFSLTVSGLTAYSAKSFAVTFASNRRVDSTAFASKVDYGTGNAPVDVAVGDLDGDGKPDNVAVNMLAGTVSVFRNLSTSGNVSYASRVDFGMGSNPDDVAIADIDGDGKLDIIAANQVSNTVSILKSTSSSGSIAFAARVDVATGASPSSLAVGDLDGDGRPEIVVANNSGSSVSVLRNLTSSGGLSFAAKVDFPTGTNPQGISLADVDGDGKLDIVVANYGSNSVSVLRNTSTTGALSFATKVDFATGVNPYSITVGDMDGDTKPDLVVANWGSNSVSLLRNTGAASNPSFDTKTDLQVGSNPTFVTLGDIDGDGNLDIVATNYASNSLSVVRNLSSAGTLTFAARVDFRTGTGPQGVALVDVDADGKPDIVLENSTSNTVSVLLNTLRLPPRITALSTYAATAGTALQISGSNFDATSSNDIVYFGGVRGTVTGATTTSLTVTVPSGAAYAPVSVTVGGSSAYTSQPFILKFASSQRIDATWFPSKVDVLSGSGYNYVVLADIDGDGKLDVLAASLINSTITVLRNTSSTGSATFATKVDLATGTTPVATAYADVDGDGKLDVVTTNNSGSSISVLRNTSTSGSVSFASSRDFATGTHPQGIAIGDLDGDGKPDVVVASFDGNTVSVLRNTSSNVGISFATKVDFGVGSSPQGVSLADVDGDGKLDIVVANTSGNTVSVLRNTSSSGSITTGSFAAKVDFSVGRGPASVAIGDVDGDGKPDVLTANTGSNTVSVLRNTSSSGIVSLASNYYDAPTNLNPQFVSLCDLDGDGKPDVAVAEAAGNTISVLRNTSTSGNISLAGRVSYPSGTNSQVVASGDVDGDGKPDLVAANYGSNATISVLLNTLGAPQPPQIVKADSGNTQVTLWWTRVPAPDFLRYRVYGGTSSGPTTKMDSTSAGNSSDTTKTITGLTNNVPYYFRVTAVDSSGSESAFSNEKRVTPIGISPPVPTLLSPLNGAIGQPSNVTISWNASLGATSYRLQVSTDSTFLTAIYDQSNLTGTSQAMSGLPASTKLFWHVNAKNSSGTSNYSATWNFTTSVAPPLTPVLLSPVNGATNQPLNVMLIWRASTGAASYRVQVSRDQNFTPVDYDQSGLTDTSLAMSGLSSGTTYYWRVSATNAGGTSSLSSPWLFTTLVVPPQAPTLLSPADGALNQPTNLTMSWNNSIGATSYRLQVSTNLNFDTSFADLSNLLGTSQSISGLATSKKYYWRVNATNSAGSSPWSSTRTFTTNPAPSTLVGISLPDTVATVGSNIAVPVGVTSFFHVGSFTLTILFDRAVLSYTGVSNQPSYGSFNSTPTATANANGSVSLSWFNVSPALNIGDGTLLKLQFTYNGGTSLLTFTNKTASSVTDSLGTNLTTAYTDGRIRTADSVRPSAPLLLSPANGSINQPTTLTFSWNSSIGAASYRLQVATDTGFSSPFTDQSGITNTSYQVGGLALNTKYYWRVRATNAGGTSAWSSPLWSFSTIGAPTPPTISSISPVSGPTGSTVAINGTNFSTTLANNVVYFGTVKSSSISAGSSASLTVTVPTAAPYAPVSVLVGGLTASSRLPYSITYPGGVLSSASFTSKVDLSTGINPQSIALGDVDGDGKLDLVVVNSNSNTVSVYRNTSTSGSITSSSFASRVDFTTGNYPISVVLGDVDGDGRVDLVVANYGSNSISILRNTSTGVGVSSSSFASKVDFAAGNGPYGVSVGDFDGDGKPDLAAANAGASTVSVLRNTSTSGTITSSSFASKVDFVTGSAPSAVAAGDMDGDGKIDLVVANWSSNTVSVHRNTSTSGSIAFVAKVEFSTGNAPYSVALGDVDGDGKLDIAVANWSSNTASVLRNTSASGSISSSSFSSRVDFATGSAPYSIALADLDGDGKADIVVTNSSSNSVSVLRNTSTSGSITSGSFASRWDFAAGSSPQSVALGDEDGDGKIDIVAANYNSNTVSVLRNIGILLPPALSSPPNGSINMPTSVTLRWNASAGAASYRLQLSYSDSSFSSVVLDQSGIADTSYVLSSLPNSATCYWHVAANSASAASTYSAAWSFTTIIAPQVVSSISSFSPILAPIGTPVTINGTNFSTTAANNIVRFGGAIATVTSATSTSLAVKVPVGATYAPISVMVGGYTGFSRLSFIVTFQSNPLSSTSFASKVDAATGSNPQSVVLGDLDGDGKLDLVVANSGSNTVSVFRNTSTSGSITSGSFASKIDFTTGGSPISVALGDLDGDGKLDLVVANWGSGTVSALRNLSTAGSISTGSFAAKVDFTTGSGPYGVVLRDVDGDGKIDLLVANANSNTVSVLRNTGTSGNITTSSFSSKIDFATGTTPSSVAACDIDGDGKVDLVTANYSSNTVSVLRNTSVSGSITAGSFAPKVDFTTGSGPQSVDLGDVDGDGNPDLVVANFSGSTISVLRNTSTSGSISTSSFASKVDFPTGSSPYSVALGDMDGDGKADVVVSNVNSNSVSAFRNTSTSGSITAGSFASKVDFATGSVPYSVALGDVDGDGKIDIAAANYVANTISVFRNGATLILPPVLSSPPNASINQPTTLTLSWNASTGATSYRLQVCTDTTFSSPFADQSGITSTSSSVSGLANSTTYYWRVNASNAGVTSSWSTPTWNFTTIVGVPPTPTLASPPNGSINQPISLTLSWNASAGATSYRLQVATDTGFTSRFMDQSSISGTFSNVSSLANGTKYYWRVNASNTSGTSSWSAPTWNFTTIVGTPPPPVLLSPPNASKNQPTSVTLSWNASAGAASYRLQVATDTAFSSLFLDQSGITGTSSPVSGLAAGRTYSWHVNASNSTGTSSYSATWSFTIGTIVPTISSISPSSGPIGTTVTITGTNFSTTPSNNVVYFGAARATVVSSTSTTLTLTVPTGTTYAPISVTVGGYTAFSRSPFLVTYASNGSLSFQSKVDFVAGTYAQCIAAGDMDGDGKVDLAVVSWNNNTVSVYRNTGSSGSISSNSFASRVDFATGNSPSSIVLGDVDGDGKLDIVVANYSLSSVSVLRNTSSVGSITSSSFAAKVDYAVGSGPYGVALGDVDGDGKPDLVVANYGSNSVSALRNTSTAGSISTSSFAPKVDFSAGTNPIAIAVGDLDGDGKPDLGTANYTSNTVSLFRNTSTSGSITSSSFAAKVDFSTGSGPYGLAIGDLDGDTKSDFVVVNGAANTVSVFRSTSTSGSITSGSFSSKVDFATGSSPECVVLGDMDGDGKADLVVANFGANTASVLRNIGASGTMTASSFAPKVDVTAGTGPQSVLVGDLDGDGKLDLAMANWSSSTISVLRNSGGLAPPTLSSPSNGATSQPISLTLSWSGTTGAISCRLQVSTDPGFSTNFIDTSGVTGTSFSVNGLAAGTTYYWRVRATYAGGTSDWSSPPWSFTTGTPKIAISSSPTSFGTLYVGQSAKGTMTVTNTGSMAVSISNITSSNAAFTLGRTNLTIPTSQSDTVSITFTPMINSSYATTVRFFHNGGSNDTIRMDGTGQQNTPGLNTAISQSRFSLGIRGSSWVLLSVPYYLSDSSARTPLARFGDWKMYAYENGQYVDVTNATGAFKFTRGVWFKTISRTDTLNIAFPSGLVSNAQAYSITLPSGWSIVGSPFYTDEAGWTSSAPVQVWRHAHEVGENSWVNIDAPSQERMKPFGGYAINNGNSIPVTFTFVRNQIKSRISEWQSGDGWYAVLVVGGSQLRIGEHRNASLAADKYDYSAPPMPAELGNGEASALEGGLWSDIRPFGDGGVMKWILRVNPKTARFIQVGEVNGLPSGWKLTMLGMPNKPPIDFAAGDSIALPADIAVPIALTIIAAPGQMVERSLMPTESVLHQNYPNPFNPSTLISYELREAGYVSISIYDALGREVRKLVSEGQQPGLHTIIWNGLDNEGWGTGSGLYFCRLVNGRYSQTIKMVLLR